MPRKEDIRKLLGSAAKVKNVELKKQDIKKKGKCCDDVASMYEQLALVTAWCRAYPDYLASVFDGGGGTPPPPPPAWPPP